MLATQRPNNANDVSVDKQFQRSNFTFCYYGISNHGFNSLYVYTALTKVTPSLWQVYSSNEDPIWELEVHPHLMFISYQTSDEKSKSEKSGFSYSIKRSASIYNLDNHGWRGFLIILLFMQKFATCLSEFRCDE